MNISLSTQCKAIDSIQATVDAIRQSYDLSILPVQFTSTSGNNCLFTFDLPFALNTSINQDTFQDYYPSLSSVLIKFIFLLLLWLVLHLSYSLIPSN